MTHGTATATADGFTKIARTADLMHAKDIPANRVIDDDGQVNVILNYFITSCLTII